MGFLAILEIIRLVRSLALGSTLASQPRTHTQSGCSSGNCKSSLSAAAGKRRSSSRRSPLTRSGTGDARSTIGRQISGPAVSLALRSPFPAQKTH